MKTHQYGFGAIGIISIVTVIGLIGASGWLVWQKSAKSDNTSSAAATSSTNPTPAIKGAAAESYATPDGYTLYDNAEHGFTFAYPKEWGELIKSINESQPTLKAKTADQNNANDYITGALSIQVDDAAYFEQMASYHAYDVKPIRSGLEYNWVVSSRSDGITTGPKVGDTYDPQPDLVVKKDGFRVYQFKLSHACGEWSALVFPIRNNFVSITVPNFCEISGSQSLAQEQADAELSQYRATVLKVAETIRPSSR